MKTTMICVRSCGVLTMLALVLARQPNGAFRTYNAPILGAS
jgi:hypothetical protein